MYEATAVDLHGETRSDEHGSETSYNVMKVCAKIPNEEFRSGGPQLHAFLSLFFVPLLFDALWVYFRGPIKLVKPTPSDNLPGPTSEKEKKKPWWKEWWKEPLKEARENPLLFLICYVPCYAIGLAHVVVLFPAMVLLVFLVRAASIIAACIFSIVGNLYAALLCKQTFSNNFLDIGKICTDDGTKTRELSLKITYDGANLYMPSPAFPMESLNAGDRVLVGFGPFETLCLFRKWTQQQQAAQGV